MEPDMDRVEVVPTNEFGPCAVQMERTNSGAVWLYQGDTRIYVGPEHVINLAIALDAVKVWRTL